MKCKCRLDKTNSERAKKKRNILTGLKYEKKELNRYVWFGFVWYFVYLISEQKQISYRFFSII